MMPRVRRVAEQSRVAFTVTADVITEVKHAEHYFRYALR